MTPRHTGDEEADRTDERTDLLSWAEGAFVIRTPSPERTLGRIVALDGDPTTTTIGVARHAPPPHEFVVELPAPTTIDTFAVPVLGEFGPAKAKHVKTVVIEGSSEGPEDGFAPLATPVIEIEQETPQAFPVAAPRAVRWVRVRFVDRCTPQANDVDPLLFSELMGYGTQDPRTSAEKEDVFTGVGNLRREYDVSRNLDLSQRRAQAVVAGLTDWGIEGDRLTPRGKGEAEPIATNDSAAGKAMNRRLEVEANRGRGLGHLGRTPAGGTAVTRAGRPSPHRT